MTSPRNGAPTRGDNSTPLRGARDLPHNVEAEQAVLGAVLIDENAFDLVAALLKTGDFYLLAHQHVYAACEELAKEAQTIDPVMVNHRLGARGLLGTAVPSELVFSLSRSMGVAANVNHYARVVQDLARGRKMMLTAQRVVEQGYESGANVQSFLDSARQEIAAAASANSADDLLGRLARPLSVEMLLAARSRELLSLADLPLRHGLGEDFDRTVGGGLMPGDLVATGAAGSGAGKTAFKMQIADGLALRSEELVRTGDPGVLTPMLLISELSPEELAFRTIGRAANVAHSVLLAGRSAERFIGVEEVDRAFRTAEELVSGPLSALPRWQLVMRPHEDRGQFMAQLLSTMTALRDRTARAHPGRTIWPVLLVDPIQRWQDPALSEVEALNQLAEDLDAVADREGWIVLLTSDTNKNSATGEGNGSGVGAFRGSMKLQHSCDVVWLLEVGDPVTDPGTPRTVTIEVLKTRRGPAGAKVSFSWYAGRGLRFEPAQRPVAARVTDPVARLELLRALVVRETAKGTELTRTKLKGYREDLGGCPERRIDRLVDDAAAAGVVRLEKATGRGGKRERILPGAPAQASPPEHWSSNP